MFHPIDLSRCIWDGPRGEAEANRLNLAAADGTDLQTMQRYNLSSDELERMCLSAIRVGKKLSECSGIIERLREELKRDVWSLEQKVNEGQEWARPFYTRAEERAGMLCEISVHIRDMDHLPESTAKAENLTIRLWYDINTDLQNQFIRLVKRKPYALELGQKYNRIENELLSIRGLLSEIREYFKMGGNGDV